MIPDIMASMNPGILLNHLAALFLSFIVILVAYRLWKSYRHPFLADYAVFLLLATVWGFALWTIPGLLQAVKPASGGSAAFSRIPLVSKWFGFPFHLLQLYFLVMTLAGLLGVQVKKSFKRIYAAAAAIILAILFGALLTMSGGGRRNFFASIHAQTTNAYLIFQASLFLWGGLRARRIADAGRRWTAGWFSWLYLAGFAVYFAVTTWATWSGGMGAWLIGVYHVPPLIVVVIALRRERLAAVPPPQASNTEAEAFLARFDLTERERDIAARLMAGRTNHQIAKDLFLSHQTVKNYVSRIYRKLRVKNRLEMINAGRRGPE